MPEGLQARAVGTVDREAGPEPRIAACRTSPGTLVFIESGNTDGWIATDAAVEPRP